MPGRVVGLVCAAAVTAAALVPAAPAATPAAPTRPADRSVAGLLTQLKTLYRKAEEATEAYDATKEKLRKQRVKTRDLTVDLARSRTELSDSRDDVGRLARQQYQGHTQISTYSFLLTLLSQDREDAAAQARELSRAADRQAALVERLTRGERHADTLATRARAALDKQLSLTAKRRKQRDKVKKRLARIEKLLASLNRRQITQVAERERKDTDKAQRKLLSSGALGTPGNGSENAVHPPKTGSGSAVRPPSTGSGQGSATTGTVPPSTQAPRRTPMVSAATGQRALSYALGQIGKPYVWGAEGPNSFDCSGLTSQAWAHAGRTIPRTSQEQWRLLPHVSLSQLRPGDLVVYYKGASHVAIYAGNGQVVQAPRPGQRVKLSPLAANPVQGAVRPGPVGAGRG